MPDRTSLSEGTIGRPQDLASGPVDVPNDGVPVLLKRITTEDYGFAYCDELAFSVAGATRLVRFVRRIGGQDVPDDLNRRNTAYGNIGAPRQVARRVPIPPATTFEVYAINDDPAAPGGSFECECDGSVNYYAKPQR